METSEECWSLEQLRAAEAQIEEQKKAWELKRVASLTADAAIDEMNSQSAAAADSVGQMLTYSHEDSVNQVNNSKQTTTNTKQLRNSSCGSSASNRHRDQGGAGPSSSNSRCNNNAAKIGKRVGSRSTSTSAPCPATVPRPKRAPRARIGIVADDANSHGANSNLTSCETVVDHRHHGLENGDAVDTVDKRRKRTRSAVCKTLESTPTTSTTPDLVDESAAAAAAASSGGEGVPPVKGVSPRTRSRGTVNINLWTLDAKRLSSAGSGVKGASGAGGRWNNRTMGGSPTSRSGSSCSGSSKVIASDEFINGVESSTPVAAATTTDHLVDGVPLKKVKLVVESPSDLNADQMDLAAAAVEADVDVVT